MAEISSPGVKLPSVKPDPHIDRSKTAEIEASAGSETSGSNGGPDPDEILSGEGKTWSRWAVDQVRYAADRVVPNGLAEKLLMETSDGGDKTWSQWAAQNAIAAKDAATSNVKYVKDVAVSGLSNAAGQSSDGQTNGDGRKSVRQTVLQTGVAMKDTISGGLSHAVGQSPKVTKEENMSVQDVMNRYSTTAAPVSRAGSQQSRTQQVIDTGLGIKDGIATQLGYGPDPRSPAGARAAFITEQANERKTAVLRTFAPGAEDKELSQLITESLSHLPELLKEKVWSSSNAHKAETTSDGAVPLSTSSTSETSTSTGGLVNRVAGVVYSASEVVTSYLPTSYLPTSVSSYLPGRQTVPQESLTPPPSEPTKNHKVHNQSSEKLPGNSKLKKQS